MTMDRESFKSLCAGVAVALGAEDGPPIDGGQVFLVGGIECQLTYVAERGSAFAHFELGDPEPGTELELYRQLLDIQAMLRAHMDAVFIRDPFDESVLFTVKIALLDEQTPEGFTTLLRTLAAQVERWRDTVMRGQFIDYEALAEEVMSDAPAKPMVRV